MSQTVQRFTLSDREGNGRKTTTKGENGSKPFLTSGKEDGVSVWFDHKDSGHILKYLHLFGGCMAPLEAPYSHGRI